MTPRFIVRPAAEAEIAEAALWYESRSVGLGADRRFSEPRTAFRKSTDKPAKRLRRFPYAAYFVSTAAGIRVVACMHVKRDPRQWQRRVDR